MLDKEAQEIDGIKKALRQFYIDKKSPWDAEDSTCFASKILRELGYRKPSPELREKVKETIQDVLQNLDQYSPCLHITLLDRLVALIVPKDKPPLIKLSKDEDPSLYTFNEGTQAQREADIKWWGLTS